MKQIHTSGRARISKQTWVSGRAAGMLATLLLTAATAVAQVPARQGGTNRTVTGILREHASPHAPVPGAIVRMCAGKDTVDLISSSSGEFWGEIGGDSIRVLAYYLGKSVADSIIPFPANRERITLYCEMPNFELEGVVVVGKENVLKNRASGLVFNVKNSRYAKNFNGMEVLSITPYLQVQNNALAIVGRKGVKVYVNGKLLNLEGEALGNYVRSLRSEDIQRIEVSPNPSAQYSAEGDFGIVNIVLARRDESFHGLFSGELSRGERTSGKVLLSLDRQWQKRSVSFRLDASDLNRVPRQHYEIFYPDSRWDERIRRTSGDRDYGWMVNLDNTPTERLSWGVGYTGSLSRSRSNADDHVDVIYHSSGDNRSLNSHSASKEKSIIHEISAYLGHKQRRKGDSGFDLQVSLLDYHSNRLNNFSAEVLHAPDRINRLSTLDLSSQGVATKAVYKLPLTAIDLQVGADYSFTSNVSKSGLDGSTNVTPFRYDETIGSLFLTGEYGLSQSLILQGGLRTEYFGRKASSDKRTTLIDDKRLQLFPNVNLVWIPGNAGTFILHYSKRIERPSLHYINPFRHYSNAYSYWQGNPEVSHYMVDNMQLSYNASNLLVSFYGRYAANKYDQVTKVDPSDKQQVVTPLNYYDFSNIGGYLSHSFSLREFWNSTNELTGWYMKASSRVPDIESASGWGGAISSNNFFTFSQSSKFRFHLNGIYMTPSLAGGYRASAAHQIDLGVSARFLQDALEVTLTATDITKGSGRSFTQIVSGIKQINSDINDSRRIKLGLTYTLGVSKKKKSPRTSIAEENKQRLEL